MRAIRSFLGSQRAYLYAWWFRQLLWLRLVALRLSSGKPLLVFVRFGAIGDIICTFPAAVRLAGKYPQFHFVYVTLSEFKVLPEMARLGGSVVSTRIHCGIPRLPEWIAPISIEPRYTDELATTGSSRHLVDEFLLACGVATDATESEDIRFELAPALRAAAREQIPDCGKFNAPIVAIHTGPTWPVREWTHENWADLVKLLHHELGCRVLHIGASTHVELGTKTILPIPGAETLVGHLPLQLLVAVIEQVDLVIGVDSGILHLAGAVGTPSVGIFGPTNPELRLPRHVPSVGVFKQLPCSFCHHRQPRLHWTKGCPYDIRCMHELSPTRVFDACRELLHKSGVGSRK